MEYNTSASSKSVCIGKIPIADKLGRTWAIPADANKPPDGRETTGEYKNWRKRQG